MDYLYYLRRDHADLVDPQGKLIWRFTQQHLENLIVRGFMNHVKDVRGLWSYLYDVTSGKEFRITEADRVVLVR